jgi:hypothetical protein
MGDISKRVTNTLWASEKTTQQTKKIKRSRGQENSRDKIGWECGFLLCVPNSGVFLGMFLRIPKHLGQQD